MKTMISTTVFAFALATSIFAQQPPNSAPQKEHQWLKQFVGEWETNAEAVGPGQPQMKCQGTMRSRMLGELWVITENETEMMGMRISAVQTIGYDPETKKYVGTWVDSMLNHMWKYEGTVDDSGKVLTLEAEGPNFEDSSKKAKYRDVYEFKSKDQITINSAVQTEDGNWVTFMTGNAKRKK